MSDDARQRARAAAAACLSALECSGSEVLGAIEAYFDERMRGEDETPQSRPWAMMRAERDVALERYGLANDECLRLRARVAELEAVVRAADAMRTYAFEFSVGDRTAARAYDAARTKVEVPRG